MAPKQRVNTFNDLVKYERLYAPLKILSVVRTLGELGVDARSLLAGTGLAQAEVTNAHTRTSIHQFLCVSRNAARLSPSPNWGVLVGSQMHLTDYGMYGYALVCAEKMRNACDLAVHYHGLATPVMHIHMEEDNSKFCWVFPTLAETGLSDVDESLFRSLLEMQLGIHTTLTKDVMGTWCVPSRAMFAQSRTAYAGALERSLECPVVFNQPRTELQYPIDWLDRRPQFANPITATQVSAMCAKLLEEHKWGTGLTRRIYAELMRTPGRFPTIDEIAATLCMSSRTVRRKLDEEGTSYSSILSSVRHALAVDYLSTSLLEIHDIAAALGFSDPTSFRHAFKRWTGVSPNQYRTQ